MTLPALAGAAFWRAGSPLRGSKPLPLPLLVSMGLLLVTLTVAPLQGQDAPEAAASGAVSSARAAATMDVAPVTQVEPAHRVTLGFDRGRVSTRDTGPIEATCAANVRHRLQVRRVGGTLGDGRVEWSADGGGSWSPLRSEPSTVRRGLSPGRHDPCADLRFRTRTDGGGEAAEGDVVIKLQVRPENAGGEAGVVGAG